MMAKGQVLKTDSGRTIRVERLLKGGGQGDAYLVEEPSGKKGVVKVFHGRFANRDTVKRLRFLVDQDLDSDCPVLVSPIDLLSKRGVIGHVAHFAEGEALEEFLAAPSATFSQQMQLAIALAQAVRVLHSRKIAHGDLHAENLMMKPIGTILSLHLIDLDNFNAPGMPSPPCAGHNLYMAPELRSAIARKRPTIPTIESDLYSLGVLMHEIILLCHPSQGNDGSEADFVKAMCSGKWLMDPAGSRGAREQCGGYPPAILNVDLARLFRSSVSLTPESRPSAERWVSELVKAVKAIYCCPNSACRGPCIIDSSKTRCPLCGEPFPPLRLCIERGAKEIVLAAGATCIGRDDLGGSPRVSQRHAIFRRIGPETWIECLGRNGTYRWTGSGWIELPAGKLLLAQAGDRLRLADVEVELDCYEIDDGEPLLNRKNGRWPC